jgi:hypothetical protein
MESNQNLLQLSTCSRLRLRLPRAGCNNPPAWPVGAVREEMHHVIANTLERKLNGAHILHDVPGGGGGEVAATHVAQGGGGPCGSMRRWWSLTAKELALRRVAAQTGDGVPAWWLKKAAVHHAMWRLEEAVVSRQWSSTVKAEGNRSSI